MAKTVVGLYEDINKAHRAVEDLVNSGFSREDISLVASNATGEYDRYMADRDQQARTGGRDRDDIGPGEGAGIGAGIGAAIGGLGGLLMGLGLLAIPGVGPALAAGPIVSALVGAGIGAAAGGLAGALVNMGVPEEEAGYYAEGVRRGGTLVTLTAADDRADRAVDIMDRYDPIDIHERAAQWRDQGWTGYDRNAEPYGAEEIERERARYRTATSRTGETRTGETTLPVVEEDVQVGKREVQRGGVRVRSYMSERPVEEQVRLREEHVDVERRPVNRPASDEDLRTFQEGTIEMQETAEEPVVSKRSRVVEEVVLHKDVDERTETIRETARRTDVDVERIGEERVVGERGFEAYSSDFRNHYNSNFASSGYTYEDYEPLYRFGYNLSTHSDYRNRDWSSVEPDARRRWEERNPGTWEQFKDSIHYAWDKARGRR